MRKKFIFLILELDFRKIDEQDVKFCFDKSFVVEFSQIWTGLNSRLNVIALATEHPK